MDDVDVEAMELALIACRVERDAALHQLRQVTERLHEIQDHLKDG